MSNSQFGAYPLHREDKLRTQVKIGERKPVLDVELNEMQDIQNRLRTDLVKAGVHSGALAHSDTVTDVTTGTAKAGEFIFKSNEPSSFGIQDLDVLVNGVRIHKEGGSFITIPEPPERGTRTDLVYLEAWYEEINADQDTSIVDSRYGAETNRRVELKWEIRVKENGEMNSLKPRANKGEEISEYTFAKDGKDKGLYVAGDGSDKAKSDLGAADGKVYSMPLAKVKRRNNGGWRAGDIWGALNYFPISHFTVPTTIYSGSSGEIVVRDTVEYNAMQAGQRFYNITASSDPYISPYFDVLSKGTGQTAVVRFVWPKFPDRSLSSGDKSKLYALLSDRPDGKYANIVHPDDIIDLRHRVSLTGEDFDKLLKENFDRLLRGEGEKVQEHQQYNLVPAPEDAEVGRLRPTQVTWPDGTKRELENLLRNIRTIRSLSGSISNNPKYTLNPEDSTVTISNNSWARMHFQDTFLPEGHYLYVVEQFPLEGHGSSGTDIDVRPSGGHGSPLHLSRKYGNGVNLLKFSVPSGGLEVVPAITSHSSPTDVKIKGPSLYRVTEEEYAKIGTEWSDEEVAKRFPYVSSYPQVVENLAPAYTDENYNRSFSEGYRRNVWGRDGLQITNGTTSVLGRGFGFPAEVGKRYRVTIAYKPAKDGATLGIYAGPALNENQANTHTNNYIEFPATATTMYVRLLRAGQISDNDPVIVKHIQVEELPDKTSPVLVPPGKWYLPEAYAKGEALLEQAFKDGRVVKSQAQASETVKFTVDATATPQKFITVTQATAGQWAAGDTIKVKSSEGLFGETLSASVAGTWTGAGTDEATFTITTPPTTNTDSIILTVERIYPAGEGMKRMPEKVVAVEVNGIEYEKKDDKLVTILETFEGKTAGSTDAVPHWTGSLGAVGLQTPDKFTETSVQANYDALAKQDGTLYTTTTSGDGQQAQQLFVFDVVEAVERQYGRIPAPDRAGKVAWVRNNVHMIALNWYGYGTSVGGAKASIEKIHPSAPFGSSRSQHSQASPSLMPGQSSGSTNTSYILDDGCMKYLALAEPSDGSTPSTIHTDRIELVFSLKADAENKLGAYETWVAKAPKALDVDDPSLFKPGENMIPPFTDTRWEATGYVTDGYKAVITSTLPTNYIQYTVKVKPNTTYTIHFAEVGGAYHVRRADGQVTYVQSASTDAPSTFTTDSVTREIYVRPYRGGTSGELLSAVFRNPMLTPGDKAYPFVPYEKPRRKNKRVLDFKDKVPGSLTVPHRVFSKSGTDTTLGPETFTNEVPKQFYEDITKSDGTLAKVETHVAGEYAMAMFEFDLSHLGLSREELVKSLRRVHFVREGYGEGSVSGNKSYGIKGYTYALNSGLWYNTASHDSSDSSPATKLTSFTSTFNNHVSTDLKWRVLLRSMHPASNDTPAVLYIDHVKLEIPLADWVDKVKKNVIHIKPETKEVRLGFPTHSQMTGREDVIRITYDHVKQPEVIPASKAVQILAEEPNFFVTDLAPVNGHKQGKHHYINPLYRLNDDRLDVHGNFGFAEVPFAVDSKGANIGSLVTVDGKGFLNNYTRQYGIPAIQEPMVGMARYLVEDEGELKLLVFLKHSISGELETDNQGKAYLIPLKGRPLVKVDGGKVRPLTIPTAWKTPSGEIQGYLNQDGEFIATYQ